MSDKQSCCQNAADGLPHLDPVLKLIANKKDQDAPKRAFTLTIEIGADTRNDLVDELERVAQRVDRDELSSGASGGSSSGCFYELKINPEQTHDRYFEQVRQYLDSRNLHGD